MHVAPNTKRRGETWRHESGAIYRHAPWHPHADADGYVAEHRLVMEAYVGRLLRRGERIFHRNEDKGDNRIANLRLQINPRPAARR